jgi:hypothetical protein
MAFLILDGFTGHKAEMIEEAFTQYGVFEIVLLAHSSDRTHPLDLGISAIYKMESHRIHAHVDLSAQAGKLLKMFWEWRKVTTLLNIITAFQNGEIVGKWNAETNAFVCRGIEWRPPSGSAGMGAKNAWIYRWPSTKEAGKESKQQRSAAVSNDE